MMNLLEVSEYENDLSCKIIGAALGKEKAGRERRIDNECIGSQ